MKKINFGQPFVFGEGHEFRGERGIIIKACDLNSYWVVGEDNIMPLVVETKDIVLPAQEKHPDTQVLEFFIEKGVWIDDGFGNYAFEVDKSEMDPLLATPENIIKMMRREFEKRKEEYELIRAKSKESKQKRIGTIGQSFQSRNLLTPFLAGKGFEVKAELTDAIEISKCHAVVVPAATVDPIDDINRVRGPNDLVCLKEGSYTLIIRKVPVTVIAVGMEKGWEKKLEGALAALPDD